MFDFTRLSRVPVIEDITSASYALVTDYSDKNDEVKRAPLDFLKADYTDVTNDFISSIEGNDAKKTYSYVLNYITSTLTPMVINEGGNEHCLAKNYYIGLDSDYYFIKTFGSISSTCHIIQRYSTSDNAITEYKYNNLEKISEIRYAPNKLSINTFTDFTNGLNASKLKINQIDFSTPSTRIIGLTGSKSYDMANPVINIFASNNSESSVVDPVRLNGIAAPSLDNDAANKAYVDKLFNELSSSDFDRLTAEQIKTGRIELYDTLDDSAIELTCASGKLYVEDGDSDSIIITNVAPGINDLDVVNVGQLKAYVKDQMDGFDPDVSLDWDDIDNKPEDIFIYDSEDDKWYIGLDHIHDFPTYIGQDFIQSPNIIGGTITGANIIGGSLTIDGTLYNGENSGSVLVTNSNGDTTFKIDEYGNVFINGTVQISGSESNIDWSDLGDLPWQEDVDAAVNTANAALSATQGAKAYYGSCRTASTTATKEVTTNGNVQFIYDESTSKPFIGTSISVLFYNKHTTSNEIKLKVGPTEAIKVWSGSSGINVNSIYNWDANSVVSFIYDGEYWLMSDTSAAMTLGQWCYNNNTTYINGGVIAAGTIMGKHIYAGSITTGHMTANTINGDRIKTDTLNANRIKANTLKAEQIYTGTLDARSITLSCKELDGAAGGGFAYAEGDNGKKTTTGAMMYAGDAADEAENYFIVTDGGVRMTVGDGTSTETSFYVDNGSICASTAITTTSDRNMKHDISYDMSKYTQFYRSLRPVSFLYNAQTNYKKHLGLIAQDVENAINSCGITIDDVSIISKHEHIDTCGNSTYYYSVSYGELTALNISMIQNLLSKVDDLEKEIANLKSSQL